MSVDLLAKEPKFVAAPPMIGGRTMKDAEIKTDRPQLFEEFVTFVRGNKKLWLIPLVLVAILVVTAIVLSQSGALAPFMYTPS